MRRIIRFDFGHDSIPAAKGYIKVGQTYMSSRFLWVSRVNCVQRKDIENIIDDRPIKDFVSAQKCEFRVGLKKGKYLIKLLFYDPLESYDPFKVEFYNVEAKTPMGGGKRIMKLDDVIVKSGEVVEKDCILEHEGGVLAVRFTANEGKRCIVNALEIYSCKEELFKDELIKEEPVEEELSKEDIIKEELVKIFDDAPSDILPSVYEVEAEGRDDPEAMLKEICRWLVANRTSDGFLGDITNYGETNEKYWYTTSYPIRTLLTAYYLFDESEYLDISVNILDKFVSEQLPEGAFTQVCRNQPISSLSESDINYIKSRYWMNLADVGSMVAALASACYYVDTERKSKYMEAVNKYYEGWALRFQHQDGGFYNGWLAGKFARNVYSVSTATTSLGMAIYSKVSGNPKYMNIAEKAISFLIRDWNDNGQFLNWPFDGTYPDKPHYQLTTYFGDGFYILEAIVAARLSSNKDIRKNVYNALEKYFFGSEGLIKAKNGAAWYPLQDIWHNSKSAAIPLILIAFHEFSREFGIETDKLKIIKNELRMLRKFICTPKYARLLGVMVDDPDLPWGPHSLQSWTGCSISATGFAGLALAEMIKPGITYLDL
ncbi:MAG: hypothetical protein HPY74_17195 [Firmicutes bacterium]|nr:hypothetical protein [Bacillota bacterium]